MRTNIPLVFSASIISLAIGAGAGILGTMWFGYRIQQDNDWGNRPLTSMVQTKGTPSTPARIQPEQRKAKKPRPVIASLEVSLAPAVDADAPLMPEAAISTQSHFSRNVSASRAALTAS